MDDTSIFVTDYYIWAYGDGDVNWTPSTYLAVLIVTSTSVATATIQYFATITDF